MRLRACRGGFLLCVLGTILGACAMLPERVRVEVDDRSIEYEDKDAGKVRRHGRPR